MQLHCHAGYEDQQFSIIQIQLLNVVFVAQRSGTLPIQFLMRDIRE